MMLLGRPLFTTVLRTVAEFRPRPQCLYICGTTGEKRSEHIVAWEGACEGVTFARLLRADRTAVCMSLCAEEKRVALRSGRSIAQFLGSGEYSSFYLDVTGLPHHVWAPFLRGILRRQEPSFCIYVEPGDYQHSETPTEAAIFDLSDRIEGIAPLPGFVSFPRVAEEEPLFVPLLGFEGARFAFMLENVQPKRENILPIIGVPGFRAEYPFYTYLGNRAKLAETRAWQNVRFAAANCPFALYNLLCELSDEAPGRRMVLAAIGTKPHALGAVLYCLQHPRRAELLYDHPVRKATRTSGTSRVCVYDLSRMPRMDP